MFNILKAYFLFTISRVKPRRLSVVVRYFTRHCEVLYLSLRGTLLVIARHEAIFTHIMLSNV